MDFDNFDLSQTTPFQVGAASGHAGASMEIGTVNNTLFLPNPM
jgi:hypothetical protein